MAVTVEIKNQQKKLSISPPQIKKIIRTILRKEGVSSAHLSVVFVTDRTIRSLNKRFLGRDYVTDCLAFDLRGQTRRVKGKPGAIEGEIVISAPMAVRNAKDFGSTSRRELILYVVHGVLHLLGYDDRSRRDKARMRAREEALLNTLKI